MIKFGSGTVKARGAFEKMSLGPWGQAPYMEEPNQFFYYVFSAEMDLLRLASFNAIVGIAPPNIKETAGYNPLLTSLGMTHFSSCLSQEWGAPGYTIWHDHQTRADPRYSFKTVKA